MSDVRPPPKMGPGRRAVFRPDHKSFGAFMRSDQMRDVTAHVAGDIRDEARARSTRSAGPGPHMADQWVINRAAGLIKVSGNIRVVVDVLNPDIAAAAQEFGSGSRRGQRRRLLAHIASRYGDFRDHGES